MGREIRLRATSYCSRSRFLYSAGTSYVSVVLSNSLNSSFSGREECLQYASQTCKA